MNSATIIVDTGPLVAFLNKGDRYHEWTMDQLGEMNVPLLTCEAVISEACFLLRRFDNGASKVMALLERQILMIPFKLEGELGNVRGLLSKYSSVPMSLADACLVRMSELFPKSTVFTLDRDFKIYRRNKRNVIPVIMPGGKVR
jgi:uncharacterized protein